GSRGGVAGRKLAKKQEAPTKHIWKSSESISWGRRSSPPPPRGAERCSSVPARSKSPPTPNPKAGSVQEKQRKPRRSLVRSPLARHKLDMRLESPAAHLSRECIHRLAAEGERGEVQFQAFNGNLLTPKSGKGPPSPRPESERLISLPDEDSEVHNNICLANTHSELVDWLRSFNTEQEGLGELRCCSGDEAGASACTEHMCNPNSLRVHVALQLFIGLIGARPPGQAPTRRTTHAPLTRRSPRSPTRRRPHAPQPPSRAACPRPVKRGRHPITLSPYHPSMPPCSTHFVGVRMRLSCDWEGLKGGLPEKWHGREGAARVPAWSSRPAGRGLWKEREMRAQCTCQRGDLKAEEWTVQGLMGGILSELWAAIYVEPPLPNAWPQIDDNGVVYIIEPRNGCRRTLHTFFEQNNRLKEKNATLEKITKQQENDIGDMQMEQRSKILLHVNKYMKRSVKKDTRALLFGWHQITIRSRQVRMIFIGKGDKVLLRRVLDAWRNWLSCGERETKITKAQKFITVALDTISLTYMHTVFLTWFREVKGIRTRVLKDQIEAEVMNAEYAGKNWAQMAQEKEAMTVDMRRLEDEVRQLRGERDKAVLELRACKEHEETKPKHAHKAASKLQGLVDAASGLAKLQSPGRTRSLAESRRGSSNDLFKQDSKTDAE
ncbi:hypothetical protein CYMTET_20824, partial [Cymbomonas tetramitiformis]